MAKDAGKKSFLDFFKVKNIDDDEDEFDDDLFDDDDYDDDDDDDYEDVKPRASKSKPSFSKPAARSASKYEAATQQASTTHRSTAGSSSSGKLVDFKDSQKSYSRSSDFRNRSEVFVIKPQETDEAQSVIDFLRANKTIVINIEGLDVAVAQRIIDYVGGACFECGIFQHIYCNTSGYRSIRRFERGIGWSGCPDTIRTVLNE